MLTALPRPASRPAALPGPATACVAVYRSPGEPPRMHDFRDADRAALVERVFECAASWTELPVVAVREVVENLVHADFAGALVSVLDAGRILRVSDVGPGILDKGRAQEPGFTTADANLRRIIRGVGCGLAIAGEQLAAVGGTLDIADNLERGAVVTLSAPVPACMRASVDLDQESRHVLALLVEIPSAAPETLARELDLPVPACGRALVALEQRALVARDDAGERTITPRGSDLIASLF